MWCLFGVFLACTRGSTALFHSLGLFFFFYFFCFYLHKGQILPKYFWAVSKWITQGWIQPLFKLYKKATWQNCHFSVLDFYACCSKHYHLDSFIPKYCLPEISVFWVIVNTQSKFKVHWSEVNFSYKTD